MVILFQSWLDPVHHHGGGAGGAGRHPLDAGADPHHDQRRVAHGCHHGGRHRGLELDPARQLRQRSARRKGGHHAAPGGAGGGADPSATGHHDRPGDDHRHDPDGARPRRGGRAERAARPRGHRRPRHGHRRDAVRGPRGICDLAGQASEQARDGAEVLERKRAPRHLPGHPQALRRIHPGRGRRRARRPAADQGGGAQRPRAEDRLRSVGVRAGRHRRRGAGGDHLLPAGLADGRPVPRQLAEHGHRLHLHPAGHLLGDRGAEPLRPHHQHHDAGRAGAGHRHARRRRHRRGGEHPPQPHHGEAAHPGHPRRRPPDRGAGHRRHAVDLHRLLPGGAAGGAGALPLHAARHLGRAGDAGLLPPVADAGPRPGPPADAQRAPRRAGRRAARGRLEADRRPVQPLARREVRAVPEPLRRRPRRRAPPPRLHAHDGRRRRPGQPGPGVRGRHRLLPVGRRRPHEAALPGPHRLAHRTDRGAGRRRSRTASAPSFRRTRSRRSTR